MAPLQCLVDLQDKAVLLVVMPPAALTPSYLEIKGWCGFRDRNIHGLTEAQARDIITKLRQGIGPDLDS